MNFLELIAIMLTMQRNVCPVIAHSQSEAREIQELARELVPANLANVEFETIKVQKCGIPVNHFDGRPARREELSFEGYFPYRSTVPDARSRDIVKCDIRTITVYGVLQRKQRKCDYVVETFLTFTGIPSEISVGQGSGLSDVREYLSHLSSQVGTIIDGRVFSEEEFQKLSRVRVHKNDSGKYLYASYTRVGCQSTSIQAVSKGNSALEFSALKRREMTC